MLDGPVRCGGVEVGPRDVVVGDEEGVVVIPANEAESVLARAEARAARTPPSRSKHGESAHRARVEEILEEEGLRRLTPAPD